MLVHPSSAQFGCAQRMAGHVKRWTPPQSHAGSLDTPRRCPTTHTYFSNEQSLCFMQWRVWVGGELSVALRVAGYFKNGQVGWLAGFLLPLKWNNMLDVQVYVPQTLAQNIPAISQSSILYFVVSRSSMEAGVRLDLGGGTAMARPAPLLSPSSIRGWRESLTEVEWCQRVEPGVQRLSGCPNRQEPRRRSISR